MVLQTASRKYFKEISRKDAKEQRCKDFFAPYLLCAFA
jgi:hypothetical protein